MISNIDTVLKRCEEILPDCAENCLVKEISTLIIPELCEEIEYLRKKLGLNIVQDIEEDQLLLDFSQSDQLVLDL